MTRTGIKETKQVKGGNKKRAVPQPLGFADLEQMDLFDRVGERPDSPLVGSVKNARTMMV